MWTRVIRARALRLPGRVDEAIEVADVVVSEYRDSISPKGGPRRAEAERELALALLAQASPPRARAIELLESVLAQRRSSLGDDSPLTRVSAEELARATAAGRTP